MLCIELKIFGHPERCDNSYISSVEEIMNHLFSVDTVHVSASCFAASTIGVEEEWVVHRVVYHHIRLHLHQVAVILMVEIMQLQLV